MPFTMLRPPILAPRLSLISFFHHRLFKEKFDALSRRIETLELVNANTSIASNQRFQPAALGALSPSPIRATRPLGPEHSPHLDISAAPLTRRDLDSMFEEVSLSPYFQ